MPTEKELQPLPEVHSDPVIASLLRRVNQLLVGRIISIGTFEMLDTTTTTTVSDNRFLSHMTPVVVAAETGAPTDLWISDRSTGSFEVTHSDPGADKDFLYAFFG